MAEAQRLLASLDVPPQDGAGGAVAKAFADDRDAASEALSRRAERLDRLADAMVCGTQATEATDTANGLAVTSAVAGGMPGLVEGHLGLGSSTLFGGPLDHGR